MEAVALKFYAEFGLEKMLAGFESCVKHSAPNLAYLEACLKGSPKKAKGSAQDYEQRDYSEIDADMKRRQAERIAERMKGAG